MNFGFLEAETQTWKRHSILNATSEEFRGSCLSIAAPAV
jgi:hypothetical protein